MKKSNESYFVRLRPDRLDRLDVFAMLLLAGFWCVFFIKSPAPLHEALVDDSYIFQRVVDNIWAGQGWTYNAGDNVNPITSPFYVLVLLCAKVFYFLAQVTLSGAYLLALFVLGAGIYLGMRNHGRSLACMMAITASSGSILVSSWGMETSLFMACIVWATLSFAGKHYRTAGLLCAMASLSRPEGLALIWIFAGMCWLKGRKISWGMIIVFCVTIAPWLLFSWVAHGRILPNSVSVKAVQADMAWLKPLGPWLMYFLSQPKIPWVTYPLALIGLYYAWREYLRGKPFILIIMGFGALQVVAYSLMHAPIGYFWYLAPGNLALDIGVAFGVYKLLMLAASRVTAIQAAHVPKPVGNAFVVMAVFFCMLKFTSAPHVWLKPYRLGVNYTDAGSWINKNTPKDAVVAATEIGYIG